MQFTRRGIAFGLAASSFLMPNRAVPAAVLAAIKNLRPGEFVWRPEISPRGPLVIVVSLPEQLVHVYRNGVTIGVSTCSTGNRTPTGVFTITEAGGALFQHVQQRPNAEHAAVDLEGYRASRRQPAGLSGLARLHPLADKILRAAVSVTQLGMSVIIADQETAYGSVVRPDLVLTPDMAKTAHDATKKAAGPGKSSAVADKVMSVLVSSADRKAYLIVDGEVTFETPINLLDPDKPIGTHLFSLIGPSPDGHALKWSAFGLGGHPHDGVVVDMWSSSVLGRIEYLDGEGVRHVARTLHPGTTMVITEVAAKRGPHRILRSSPKTEDAGKTPEGLTAATIRQPR